MMLRVDKEGFGDGECMSNESGEVEEENERVFRNMENKMLN
jgi:hypothetical protein